jgi:hypothetical protein
MTTIADVEAKPWQPVAPALEFSGTLAIPKKWCALKAAGSPIGVPAMELSTHNH